MTREEAIESIKLFFTGIGIALSNRTKEALDVLIPELHESEDERIRKWLVDYFTKIGENWIHREFTCEQIVAYLEKQKESLHVPETCKEDADSFTSEDEKFFRLLHAGLYAMKVEIGKDAYDKAVERLKFLRSRPKSSDNWKPSEEQMKALKYAAYHMLPGEEYRDMLFSLFKDLKKLM